jgi:hypothetical protein
MFTGFYSYILTNSRHSRLADLPEYLHIFINLPTNSLDHVCMIAKNTQPKDQTWSIATIEL